MYVDLFYINYILQCGLFSLVNSDLSREIRLRLRDYGLLYYPGMSCAHKFEVGGQFQFDLGLV